MRVTRRTRPASPRRATTAPAPPTSSAVSRQLVAVALGSSCCASCVSTALTGVRLLERTNFHGRQVSLRGGAGTAVGAVVAAACAAAPGARLRRRGPHRAWSALGAGSSSGAVGGGLPTAALAALVAAGAGGAAGLADDLDQGAHDGEHTAKGLKGHLSALARGRVTTGVVKVAVIGSAAVAAGGLLAAGRRRGAPGPRPGTSSWGGLLDAAGSAVLIASWANVVNLLDLRPGRALKAAGGLSAALLLAPGERAQPARSLAAGALGVTVAALPEDLRERTMLGDTGANALGALVGTAVAAHPSRVLRGGAAVLGAALVLVSEKVSFTAVIERTPLLARLDRLGRP